MLLTRWMKALVGTPSRSPKGAPTRHSKFWVEVLEDRALLTGNFATGAAFGEAPIVRVFDGNTQQQVATVQVFDTGFKGGVNVAMGDVTGDGVNDVIAGSALGFSHVKVYDGVTFQEVRSFLAFAGFTGGVNVAAGDIDGDGKADIAVAVANGGGTHIKAFSGADSSELASFFAYGQGFVGGVRVTLGDVDGDGKADIVTGAGPGSGGHVKVFQGGTGTELRSFLVFDGFSGSIDLAVGDLNGDGKAEVLVGAGPGAGPHVKAYDGATGALNESFFAFAQAFLGGVSVGADADGNILVAGTGRGHVKTFDGVTGAELTSSLVAGSASGRLGTAPEPTRPLVITSGATASAAENQTAVTTVTTTGGTGAAVTYSIVGGADQSLFAINPTTGALTFLSAPDFEEPADAGTNNVYDVTVQASDGTRTTTQAVTVTVTDVNEASPLVITSGATASAAENQTAVTTVTTTGGTGAAVTYSIVGGADQSLFAINPTTGVLTFLSARNFESPADAGTNNVYDVTVQATDGTFTTTQAVAVTVTDVNDAPVGVANSVIAFTDVAYTFSASDFVFTDADSDALLAVKITTLPSLGTLTLSGAPISAGAVIAVADIGTLQYNPPVGAYSGLMTPYTTFTFQVQDNGGTASGGVDLDPTPRTMSIYIDAV